MRASEALVIEADKSWERLQRAKEFFFADLDAQMKENHRRFLEMLMMEERQRFLQAYPYPRHQERAGGAEYRHRWIRPLALGRPDWRMHAKRSAIAILGHEKASTPMRFEFIHRSIDRRMQH